MLAVLPLVQGCYTYVPVEAPVSPPVGERVSFEITDEGRAQLSNRLGPGVLQVDGTLTRADSTEYELRVWGLSQLGMGRILWSGEVVEISRGFVSEVRLRQLSRTRTYLTVGAVAVGLYAFAQSQALLGGGRGVDEPENPDPPSESIIWSWK